MKFRSSNYSMKNNQKFSQSIKLRRDKNAPLYVPNAIYVALEMKQIAEIDFHGMRRRRLQSLCKKHGIPANLKKREIADRLSQLLKGKEKGTVHCIRERDTLEKEKNNQEILAGDISELKSSSLENHNKVASDIAAGHADRCEVKFAPSEERSSIPDSEEINGFSLKLLKNSMVEGLEPGGSSIFHSKNAKRYSWKLLNMESTVKKELVDHSQKEALNAAPSVMSDVVIFLEEVIIIVHDDVCGTVKGKYEAEKQVNTKSPKGSKMAMNTFGKTSVTAGHFLDEVQSASCTDSDETPDQFLPTMPQVEVNSCNLNIHHMLTSDSCQQMLPLSQKISPDIDLEGRIGFSAKLLESSLLQS